MREEGILALYKGVTPILLRAFPANAVSLSHNTVADVDANSL